MPVILPARSGYILWIRGNSLSPNICFCSWGGAAANMVAVSGSWPGIWTAAWGMAAATTAWPPRPHHLPRRVPGRLGVGEAGLGPADLLVHAWHRGHAGPGHHHGLAAGGDHLGSTGSGGGSGHAGGGAR